MARLVRPMFLKNIKDKIAFRVKTMDNHPTLLYMIIRLQSTKAMKRETPIEHKTAKSMQNRIIKIAFGVPRSKKCEPWEYLGLAWASSRKK